MSGQTGRMLSAFVTPFHAHHHYHVTTAAPSSNLLSSSFCSSRPTSPLFRHHSCPRHHASPSSCRRRSTISASIRFMGTRTSQECDRDVESASHSVTLISDERDGLTLSAMNVIETTVRTLYGGEISHWKDLADHAIHGYIQNVTSSSSASNVKRLSRTLTERILTECHDVTEDNVPNIIVQDGDQMRTPKKLAVFDMDSTLIQNETIDEIAALLNLQDEVKEITDLAMNGGLDFEQSLKQRVALLKGLPAEKLNEIKDKVTVTAGAHRLIKVLKRKYGCKTAVISGGFDFLANHIRQSLGLDHAFANTLAVDPSSGLLTGKTQGLVVDAAYKEWKLSDLAANTYGIDNTDAVMAVGDGANDIPMLTKAGLGIAFNAKPKVQQMVDVKLDGASLDQVLYLLGLDDNEIEEFGK